MVSQKKNCRRVDHFGHLIPNYKRIVYDEPKVKKYNQVVMKGHLCFVTSCEDDCERVFEVMN
jgi:hypothetical protein